MLLCFKWEHFWNLFPSISVKPTWSFGTVAVFHLRAIRYRVRTQLLDNEQSSKFELYVNIRWYTHSRLVLEESQFIHVQILGSHKITIKKNKSQETQPSYSTFPWAWNLQSSRGLISLQIVPLHPKGRAERERRINNHFMKCVLGS